MPRITTWICLLSCAGAILSGCASSERLSISHRRTLGTLARIVVLPVEVPADAKDLREGEGETLASLYATELLKSYDILDLGRFQRALEERELEIDSVLVKGLGKELREELQIDGVLLSEVYSWTPGTPGLPFLKKSGRIGFVARLIDLDSGSVIWGVNRVGSAAPGAPLSVAIGELFEDLVAEMPQNLNPY